MAGPPDSIRITDHGKIHAWVDSALQHFQNNPDKPLTFHTLPAAKKADSGRSAQAAATDGELSPSSDAKKERMPTSLSTIPRLISVVEIIKREYLKTLDLALADQGKLSGLHQYNQVGELQKAIATDAPGNPEEDRLNALALALQGKRHLRQHKVAFMKITLSREVLPDLVAQGLTYQPPDLRQLSRSARARLRKRQKKAGSEQPQLA
ncbi:hypothetical protein BKA93DRAFT_815859 [Sparassis latifolia]